jgi:hypothetical protein
MKFSSKSPRFFQVSFSFSGVVWSVDIRYSAYKAKTLATLEEVNEIYNQEVVWKKAGFRPIDSCFMQTAL